MDGRAPYDNLEPQSSIHEKYLLHDRQRVMSFFIVSNSGVRNGRGLVVWVSAPTPWRRMIIIDIE